MKKQIIVRGGSHREGLKMYKHILEQTGVENPKVTYIGTASGDPATDKLTAYDYILKCGGIPAALNLFTPVGNVEELLLSSHAIIVGGGNTRSMMALWQLWGVDAALRKAYEQGVVLAGASAGGLCWFDAGTTDSWEGELRTVQGLGLLPYSHCPHYDGEAKRRPAYHALVQNGTLTDGYAVDDAAAIHFVDGKVSGVVTLQTGKTAYRVQSENGAITEKPLEAKLLA